MKIQQFKDKGLAHFSYAVLSECTGKVALIDPSRDPQPYFDFAREHNAEIVAVIETHPHADFVSSHLEIHQKTGAVIYAHSLLGATYPHEPFDEGTVLELGKIRLKALHTPGHSPDSISVVLEHDGKDKAVFTGDTLFIGDVGRPDLRENVGHQTAKREELARQMYRSTREKIMRLSDDLTVYPAHGSGSLCGKALSNADSSSIGAEKKDNYALQDMSEEAFVKVLTEGQPFIPKYFGYNVDLNKKGAPAYEASIAGVKKLENNYKPAADSLVIDTRSEKLFKQGHIQGAFNIQNGGKFETWLGSIIGPQEQFYLVAENEEQLQEAISKAARIGYEVLIKGAFVQDAPGEETAAPLDLAAFREQPGKYTIVDVRNRAEVEEGKFFQDAVSIPLPELRERAHELPTGKPLLVHCAAGYRSAAGSSILAAALPAAHVLDLGDAIEDFKPKQ